MQLLNKVAISDYDKNGGVDIFGVGVSGGTNTLFRNRMTKYNWLTVKLKGIRCNTSGIGARVRVVAGELIQIRDVLCEFSFGLQNDIPVEFGLGSQNTIDTVEVRWPGRNTDVLTGVKANSAIIVEQGRGDAAIPISSYLKQNFPNPFNQFTTIRYQLQGNPLSPEKTMVVNLSVYNMVGQKVKTLVNENRIAGSYIVMWDSKDEFGNYVPSGVYFYKISTGEFVETKKMVLLR